MMFSTMLPAAMSSLWAQPAVDVGLFIIVLVITTLAIRRRKRSKTALEAAFAQRHSQWSTALGGTTQMLAQELESDPEGFARGQKTFWGLTELRYNQTHPHWTSWLGKHAEATRAFEEANALHQSHLNRRWWQTSLKPLKRALAKLSSDQAQIVANLASPTRESYLDFKTALVRARQITDRITEQIETEPDSIEALKKRLAEVLPLQPYLANLDKLSADNPSNLRRQFFSGMTSDPLSVHQAYREQLQACIDETKNTLKQALQYHAHWLEMKNSLQRLETQTQQLRQTEVKPGFPGAPVSGCFTLDEDECNPDSGLADAHLLIDRLEEQLKAGELKSFAQTCEQGQSGFDRLVKLADQAVADKTQVDTWMTDILMTSKKPDLLADEEDRMQIVQAYGMQRWLAARILAEELYALHSQRQNARAEADQMLARLTQTTSELKRNQDFVSLSLARDCGFLAERAKRLVVETKQSRCDWSTLRAHIREVCAHTYGAPDSLQNQMNSQMVQYHEAEAAVSKLKADLKQTKDALSRQWVSRGKLWLKLEPAIDRVCREFQQPNQDWASIKHRAEQLSVHVIWFWRGTELNKAMRACEKQLERCQKGSYSQVVCGQVYGLGVFCGTASASAHFQKAQEHFNQREFDATESEIKLTQEELGKAHLEAWWMTLQSLSMSNHNCASQFASREGYSPLGFNAWMEQQLLRQEKQGLYEPAQQGLHQQCGAYVETYQYQLEDSAELEGDAPSINDYQSVRR